MKLKISPKIISLVFSITVLIFAISFIVFAWTEPSVAPPGGNVPAPINTGGTGQAKLYVNATNKGWLGVGVDNYDSNYGLTVGYATNKLGIKTRGNSYFQGATSDSTSAALNVSNDAETNLLFIRNDGRVGIGTTNPGYKLHVNGIVGASAYYYTSDMALKTNVHPLNNSLAKILNLQGVSFNWKEGGEYSIGLIAQDVENIFPEVVSIDEEDLKSIEYGKLIAPLIEAIKEQQTKIQKLELRINALEATFK